MVNFFLNASMLLAAIIFLPILASSGHLQREKKLYRTNQNISKVVQTDQTEFKVILGEIIGIDVIFTM